MDIILLAILFALSPATFFALVALYVGFLVFVKVYCFIRDLFRPAKPYANEYDKSWIEPRNR